MSSVAAAGQGPREAAEAMSLFLLLLLVAIALGIVGFVVKGLLFLLVIGAIVLLVDLLGFAYRGGRRRRRPVR
ncbi:MAG: hypothetical protein ACYCO3_09760 [Mycobacteriales bacterium]